MTNNPYAGDYSEQVYDGPRRTSALAVSSLVLSLICCIPGVSLLGAGLGVGALIGIGSSRGRVGGKGLAVAGIIIGVLVTFAQIGALFTSAQGIEQISQQADKLLSSLEAGRYDEFRAAMSPPAANASDAELRAFVEAYQAKVGAFQSVPDGVGAYFGEFFDPTIGPIMQGLQGRQNMIPVPATFAQGKALVAIVIDPGAGQPNPADLIIMVPGDEIDLSGFIGSAPAGAPPEPEAPAPDEEP